MAGSSSKEDSIKVAIIDVETTGLDVNKDRIIQIACLILDEQGAPLQLYESYINPGGDLSQVVKSDSFKIHNIGEVVLRDAPTFVQKSNEILELLSNVDIVVGHNITFDFEILRNEFSRLNQGRPSQESDSDDSWNQRESVKGLYYQHVGKTPLDGLNFKLIDTFKLALVAFPYQKSYSLTSLAKYLQIKVKRFKVSGYRWVSGTNEKETEVKTVDEIGDLRQHDSVTDVLETELLLTKCLSTLRIKYSDIVNDRQRKFEVSRDVMLAANKLMSKVPTKEELIALANLEPEQMNVNFPERTKKYMEMYPCDIQKVISFLSSRKFFSDKRQRLVCQGFLHIVSDMTLLKKLNEKITWNKQESGNAKQSMREPSLQKNENVKMEEVNSSVSLARPGPEEGKKRKRETNEKIQSKNSLNEFPPLETTENHQRLHTTKGSYAEVDEGTEEDIVPSKTKKYEENVNKSDTDERKEKKQALVQDESEENTLEYDLPDDFETEMSLETLENVAQSAATNEAQTSHSSNITCEQSILNVAVGAPEESILGDTYKKNDGIPFEETNESSEEYPFMADQMQLTPEQDDQADTERKKDMMFSPVF